MDSRIKVAGHPLHPMLIVFPLGLLATSLIFDVVGLITNQAVWFQSSFWMIAAGVAFGLLAAIPGTVDWLAIPKGTRAKAIGAWHGTGNVIVVALFAFSWLLRRGDPVDPGAGPILLSALGVLLALVTGWLGGELVDRLGVGVDDVANLNATSSIAHKSRRVRA